jgi:hypothetical protein
MAADAGIFQQYLNPVRSVADYRGDMDKQEQNALTLAAGRLTNQQAQQTMADDQASRQASMESGGDSGKFVNALQKAGLFKQAQAYQKSQFDTQKVQADTGLANAHAGNFAAQTAASSYDSRIKKSDQAIKDIAGFKTPDEAIASLEAHIAAGDVDPAKGQMLHASIPRDPAQFPIWQLGMLRNIMSAKEQMALQVPDANTVAANTQSDTNSQRTAATAAAGRAQADRHFNTTQENSKGQIVQTDNGPVLVNTRTGTGKIVSGPDGQSLPGITKPLNDSQSKALLFGTRMQESHKILNQLAAEGTATSVPGSRAPLIGGLISSMSNGNQQMLDQAKRDFMTAVLRRESGASISSGEYDNADQQYFPQIGDDPKVIAQKARNRELAIKGILVEVPEKQRGAITPAAKPAADVHAAADAILRGGK